MPGRDKQEILDALFDEPGKGPERKDAPYQRARKLFFESGIRLPADELAPRRLWQKFHGQVPRATTGRKVWLYVVPAAVAASVVIAVTLMGWPARFSGGPGAEVARQVIKRENFSEQYQKSVNLYVRQTENFSVSHQDTRFDISADTLTARIDFSPSRVIKTVRIRTPQVVFEIIGTRISLDVTADRARLHVSEGKVKVTLAGSEEIVEAGSTWEYNSGKVTRTPEEPSDRKFFENLKPAIAAKKATAQKQRRRVRVLLNDGTELSGLLVRERSDSITISTSLAGNQKVLLKRDNIRSITSEGSEN